MNIPATDINESNTCEPNTAANQLTPRTDSLEFDTWVQGSCTRVRCKVIFATDARQLEQELAETRAANQQSYKDFPCRMMGEQYLSDAKERALEAVAALRAKVADIQEAHDKIYAFALKTVEENEALEKRVAALEVELAKGLEMVTAAHTNAAQWKMDCAHWQRRGDEMSSQYHLEHSKVAALEADKRRLDWLEGGGLDQRETRVFNIWNGGGMKFRAAIDSAIEEATK